MAENEPDSSAVSARIDRVDIGGYRLAINCRGDGRPTVVLETGLGAPSEWWEPVQRAVAEVTHVCRYDRAGRGQSDPAPRPRTVWDMVVDLKRLLVAAGVPGPYVLVGQSIGGATARLYAHTYHEDVIGLVLVDTAHSEQFDRIGPLLPPPAPDEPQWLTDFRAFWTEGWRDPSQNSEGIDFPTSLSQVRSVGSLGHIPLTVLTASGFIREFPGEAAARLQTTWETLQRDFLYLSTNNNHVLVEASAHFIQRDQPQVVIDAILDIVDVVRNDDRGA